MATIKLLCQHFVDDVWKQRREDLERRCKAVSDDRILNTDLHVLAEEISKPSFFDIPQVHLDQISADEPVFAREGKEAIVRFYVPVTGDPLILSYHGRNSPYIPTYTADTEKDCIKFTVSVGSHEIGEAKRKLDDFVGQIKQYYPEVEQSLRQFNPRFVEAAETAFKNRHHGLMANKSAAASFTSLDIPIRKRQDEVAAVYVPVARKPIQLPDSPKAIKENPHIIERAYEDILQTISAMAHGIERSPSTFAEMDEEDIRMILLVGLNAVYEGKATGETFNGAGKTDIIIKAGDHNVFIAECAVWKGEEKFQEKIDQLLGYTMWRDSKTALIVFNRTKNLTAVVEKMKKKVTGHKNSVREIGSTTGTSFRHTFKHPDDDQKQFTLTSMAFNVPE